MVWLSVFLASLVPFAFIAVEVFLQKQMNKVTTTEAQAS
jgi:hypothetical protein